MRISFGKFDAAEESYIAAKKSEDGRAAPVSGSELGVDSKDRAEDNKKSAFAQSGDRVDISEEARALQRVGETENPEAEDEQGQPGDKKDEDGLYKDFAEDVESLKGIFKGFGNAQGPDASGGGGGGGSDNPAVERLKKMIEAAQKRLQEAQEKLQAAKAEAQRAVDEDAQLAAQQKVEAAQAEVQSVQGELQNLRNELQNAQQGGGGGGGMKPPAVGVGGGGGRYGSGQRINIGPGGITSM